MEFVSATLYVNFLELAWKNKAGIFNDPHIKQLIKDPQFIIFTNEIPANS